MTKLYKNNLKADPRLSACNRQWQALQSEEERSAGARTETAHQPADNAGMQFTECIQLRVYIHTYGDLNCFFVHIF